MRSKPPSSLDYDGHLHELALRNWRRALVARDIPRAQINASTLTRLTDRFWRFVGWMHLAVAHLGGGRAADAIEALAEAMRAYPDSPELTSIARAQAAHVHVETHSPQRALEALDRSVTTPETLYWRALANARLFRVDEARILASKIDDGLLRAHILVEIDDDARPVREALARVPDNAFASPRAVAPVAFALAVRLARETRRNEARELFERIAGVSEALVYWPLPYVRALYRSGAHAEFWRLWRDGDLDRDAVATARQSIKS